MNEHARNNKYFATTKDFKRSISHFLDATLPTIGAKLSCRIQLTKVVSCNLKWVGYMNVTTPNGLR